MFEADLKCEISEDCLTAWHAKTKLMMQSLKLSGQWHILVTYYSCRFLS